MHNEDLDYTGYVGTQSLQIKSVMWKRRMKVYPCAAMHLLCSHCNYCKIAYAHERKPRFMRWCALFYWHMRYIISCLLFQTLIEVLPYISRILLAFLNICIFEPFKCMACFPRKVVNDIWFGLWAPHDFLECTLVISCSVMSQVHRLLGAG